MMTSHSPTWRVKALVLILTTCCMHMIVVEGALSIGVNEILNLDAIDAAIRPNLRTGPTVINVSFALHTLDIDPGKKIAMVSGDLMQEWYEENLQFNAHSGGIILNDIQFPSSSPLQAKVWRPDLHVAESAGPEPATPVQSFLRVYHDGVVHWVQRVYYVFPCELDLTGYPLGQQVCQLRLQSIGHDTNELEPRWKNDRAVHQDNAIISHNLYLNHIQQLREIVAIPNMVLQGARYTKISRNRDSKGNKVQLQMQFDIEISQGWTIKHTIVPMIACVLTAYLSFFINIRAIGARMTCVMLAMVTAAIFHENTYRQVPSASYTMALEVFTGTCLAFIFFAAVESVIVDLLAHKSNKHAMASSIRANYSTDHSAVTVRPFQPPSESDIQMEVIMIKLTAIEKRLNKMEYLQERMDSLEGLVLDDNKLKQELCDEQNIRAAIAMEEKDDDSVEHIKDETRFVRTHMIPSLEDASSSRGATAAQWLDRGFRVFYPSAFIAFNAIYWILYSTRSVDQDQFD